MPQIGWSEILIILIVAIIVIGPKDIPVVIRKFVQIKNTIKNYASSFQKNIDDIVVQTEKQVNKVVENSLEEKKKETKDNKDKKN
jgi:sec-independent protein translocase protein TatB